MRPLTLLLVVCLCSCAPLSEDEIMERQQRYAEAVDAYNLFKRQCIQEGGVVVTYGHDIDERLKKGKRVHISDLRGVRCTRFGPTY